MFPDEDLTIYDFMRESLELFHMDYIHNTLGFTGDGLRVGVLDTGIDYRHPIFAPYLNPATGRIRGRNFTTDNGGDPNNLMDGHGHGIHVAGTVVALAPDIELWAYKVITDSNFAEEDWIVGGVERAHADGMDVMNLSLGGLIHDPFFPFNVATNLAMLDGTVVVNAAGNAGGMGMFTIGSPAGASLPISVGSGTAGGRNNFGDRMSDFSSIGPTFGTYHLGVDIVAPGDFVVSATINGGYMAASGTSMSAPHVSGIAALMIEAFPDARTDEIKARMMNTARQMETPSPFGIHASGAGFIDPIAALTSESFATVQHNIPWLTGTTPGWRMSTMSSMSFGTVWGRTESAPLTVTINNPGAGTWNPVAVQWNGSSTGVELALTASTANTFTYQLRFAANAADGLYQGMLIFENGDRRISIPFGAQFTRNAGIPIHTRMTLDFPVMTTGDLLGEVAAFDLFNTGTSATGLIQLSLTGPDSEHFDLFEETLPSIAPGFWEPVLVVAEPGLPVGTYNVTVQMTGSGINSSVDLSLNVVPFPFTDVAVDNWYFIAVSLARQLGFMQGATDTTFAPYQQLSRAMIAVILHRAFGAPALPDDLQIFDDVPPGRWYSEAVNFVAMAGIVEGVGGGRFNPSGTVTREQNVTILYRLATILGEDMTVENETILDQFQDGAAVSNWARTAVAWAVEAGLMVGTPEGYLNPNRGTNRAEGATLLVRFFGFPV
ncbi:MAG: S8 family serine peptidase [Oscillospiraceae bacterium]|nr:S8 family serine peptidase [Oscillospiraceae bacterium]